MRGLASALALAAAGAVASCSADGLRPADASAGDADDRLSFDYVHVADPGFIDRTLTVQNNTSDVLSAELTLDGLDDDGEVLDRLGVTLAYGSHRGEMLLSPGDNVDVVMAFGADASRLRDVRVTVDDLTVVDEPALPSHVDSEALGPGGRPTPVPSRATHVRVSNPSDADLTASVVHLLYDVPPPGQAQAIQTVSYVDRAVRVPAGRSVVVPVDRELRALVTRGVLATFPSSIKAYRVSGTAPSS